MSLRNCLPDLIADGRVSRETADAVGEMFEELAAEYRKNFGRDAADAMASEEALKALERDALLKRRQQVAQIVAQERIRVGKPGRRLYEQMETHRKVVRAQALSQMDGILYQHRRNVLGEIRNKSDLMNVVRELFGENSGDLNARELADSFTGTAEWLRQRFNAAGGHIGKMDRWGLPQAHDSRVVRDAGFEAWRDFTIPKLDRERMVDEMTDQPYTDAALNKALREVYDTIRTDGWSKRNVGGQGNGKSLANRHAESRFLHFATADDWLAYADRFGHGTPFDAMIGHVEAMSRDIAAVETLGPNPTATVRWHKDLVEKEAALDADPGSKATDKAHAEANAFDRLWGEYSGANRRPESRRLALAFSSIRAVQTSAKLGGATLSATTDLAFQTVTRRYNGLPAAKTVGQYVSLLNPANKADRQFATRAGLIAETWTNIAGGQYRYLNEELTGEVSRRLAEGVLRVSGLNAWTDAGRWAFGMEFLNHITQMRGRSFDKLDKRFASAMERNGINAEDWDKIRSTPLTDHEGTGWIIPSAIEDGLVSDRLLAWILNETDYAVPTADLNTRSWINTVAPRGTWIGESVKSAFLFKSFGLSMIVMQGRRMLEMTDATSRAKYAASFILGTWAMGAAALQLKEIAKGKDPRPADDPKFWGAALLQGGGLGIFGDFLGSAENRFGGGMASTLAGPMAQSLSNVADISMGNAIRAASGEETKFARPLDKILRQELPGGSLWYTRLAFERLMLDQMQEAIDPNYSKAFGNMLRRAEDQGQDYWWEPGEEAPARAPDFSNAMGRENEAAFGQ